MHLDASDDTLRLLSGGVERFGPGGGDEDWLAAYCWLCTAQDSFIAAPRMVGGRSLLQICTPAEFAAQLNRDLTGIDPAFANVPTSLPEPVALSQWGDGPCNLEIVEQSDGSCGLLFTGSGNAPLLIAVDPTSLGLLLARDADEIRPYLASGSVYLAEDYIAHRAAVQRASLRSSNRSTASRSG